MRVPVTYKKSRGSRAADYLIRHLSTFIGVNIIIHSTINKVEETVRD